MNARWLLPFVGLFAGLRGAADEPIVAEHFVDQPPARMAPRTGRWHITPDAEIYRSEERDIYFSPEEPGHLAWVGLWKTKGGTLRTCFAQITGAPGLEPSYRPWYGRGKSPAAWEAFCREHHMRVGPEDAVARTKCVFPTLESPDRGATWRNLGVEQNPRGANLRFATTLDGRLVHHGMATLCCRDGRLVSTPGLDEWLRWKKAGKQTWDQCLIAVRESSDGGRTWTSTRFLCPAGTGADILKRSCEENAMVELADGRILTVIRCDPGPPMQTFLTRIGPGRYEAAPPTALPFRNSGMPELIRCENGVIWYWGIEGHWYSADDGATWHRSSVRLTSYYGKMVAAGKNLVLCVTQHNIGDAPYPYWFDGSIRQFRIWQRRTDLIEQTDPDTRFARAVLKGRPLTDLHLRVDMRADGLTGVVFRVSPAGGSYYAFLTLLPDHPLYKTYFPPAIQQATLSANYTPGDTFSIGLGWPMAVMVKVENEHVTVLGGMRLFDAPAKGAWIQMQVKARGDLIQGAIKVKDRAVYVGVRDSGLVAGRIGFFTDRSTGAFRNCLVWDTPRMIREHWAPHTGIKAAANR